MQILLGIIHAFETQFLYFVFRQIIHFASKNKVLSPLSVKISKYLSVTVVYKLTHPVFFSSFVNWKLRHCFHNEYSGGILYPHWIFRLHYLFFEYSGGIVSSLNIQEALYPHKIFKKHCTLTEYSGYISPHWIFRRHCLRTEYSGGIVYSLNIQEALSPRWIFRRHCLRTEYWKY